MALLLIGPDCSIVRIVLIVDTEFGKPEPGNVYEVAVVNTKGDRQFLYERGTEPRWKEFLEVLKQADTLLAFHKVDDSHLERTIKKQGLTWPKELMWRDLRSDYLDYLKAAWVAAPLPRYRAGRCLGA